MMKPLKYVSDLKPYVPGKPIEELERELGIKDCIKLASNENPMGPSARALEALREFLKNGQDLCRYPDDSAFHLKNAISEKVSGKGPKANKVNIDDIILGNGSNTLIDIAVRTYMGPGNEAVMGSPSFVSYPLAVRAAGGVCVEVPLMDYRHDLEAMAKAVTGRTRIIFIANPNNPTGGLNKRDEVERFMAKVPDGVLVVMDEAYNEYVTSPEQPVSLRYYFEKRDILILRTFSKIYGLAGLRIGYGIAGKDIVGELDKIRGPFNTNALAQLAAMSALTDDDHIRKTVGINEQGKQFLYRELDSMGVAYVPTEANFIYMHLNTESKVINDALLKMGVIVRPVGPKEIRVTIGLPEENKRFIEALKEVISKN